MDARFSALPQSAQDAVKDAANVLASARRGLTAKRKIAARAARRGSAAGIRATRLQAKMVTMRLSADGGTAR
jgi:hypothetical protein